jgi:hypothetical protein
MRKSNLGKKERSGSPHSIHFGERLGDFWRDLQDDQYWRYEELPPVELLEKLELHCRRPVTDELDRAGWFWNRRPCLLPVAGWIACLAVAMALPFSVFSIPWLEVLVLPVAMIIAAVGIVRSVRWRRQYESSIARLIRACTSDGDAFYHDVRL